MQVFEDWTGKFNRRMGQTTLNVPDPVRSRKSSRVGPDQYYVEESRGNPRCRGVPPFALPQSTAGVPGPGAAGRRPPGPGPERRRGDALFVWVSGSTGTGRPPHAAWCQIPGRACVVHGAASPEPRPVPGRPAPGPDTRQPAFGGALYRAPTQGTWACVRARGQAPCTGSGPGPEASSKDGRPDRGQIFRTTAEQSDTW
jgi:hypothetical protein